VGGKAFMGKEEKIEGAAIMVYSAVMNFTSKNTALRLLSGLLLTNYP
jgi:hypothetical protein